MASIGEIDILWITAGLSCDGESFALTSATQPSIEEIVMGGITGIPKVNFHHPFYSYDNGDECIRFLERAEENHLESGTNVLNRPAASLRAALTINLSLLINAATSLAEPNRR